MWNGHSCPLPFDVVVAFDLAVDLDVAPAAYSSLPRVPLDKSEGCVKHKSILPVFFAPLVLPEKVEDQDSGNLTLNHLRW